MPGLTILTVVGARPQFIKAAALSRAIAEHNRGGGVQVREILVHTGQHYDFNMSQVFFEELGMPEPAANLGVGSGPHGAQTGRMLEAIESLLGKNPCNVVLVYGDTNSTLAGALAAAKMGIPVAHVEAGLRSFNRAMPEELNRVLTDHISSVLFCPTSAAVENLRREGLASGVHKTGDVMYDSMLHHLALAGDRGDALQAHGLQPFEYLLATIHRAENTDHPDRLRAIFQGFGEMAEQTPVAAALHPRTREALKRNAIKTPEGVKIMEPVSYLDMLQLERGALAILTDSGGVQKEAFFLGRPCLTLRDETEWVETVELGANTLAGADPGKMLDWHGRLVQGQIQMPCKDDQPYGDGRAAGKILEILAHEFS